MPRPMSVLELGPGIGANIPFLLQNGAEYWCVEGSAFAVQQLLERFPDLQSRVVHGDFTKGLCFNGPFDIVLDRSAVTCNATDDIRRVLENVWSVLKPGGLLLAFDWFSTQHPEYDCGLPGPDRYTRTGYAGGPFEGVGEIHFSNEDHLTDLLGRFEILRLVERREYGYDGRYPWAASLSFAAWNFVARKHKTPPASCGHVENALPKQN